MLIYELKRYTRLYAKTADGNWLNTFEWEKIPLITISEFRNPDIMGSYNLGRITVRDTNLELVFSTYIHELYHQYQKNCNLMLYIVGKGLRLLTPILRRVGVEYTPRFEREADIETAKADKFILEVDRA